MSVLFKTRTMPPDVLTLPTLSNSPVDHLLLVPLLLVLPVLRRHLAQPVLAQHSKQPTAQSNLAAQLRLKDPPEDFQQAVVGSLRILPALLAAGSPVVRIQQVADILLLRHHKRDKDHCLAFLPFLEHHDLLQVASTPLGYAKAESWAGLAVGHPLSEEDRASMRQEDHQDQEQGLQVHHRHPALP